MTALVVDDDLPVARSIARAIARAGIESQVCTALSDAREELGRNRYDIILLDLLMDGAMARPFYEEVVAEGHVPVVVVSSDSDVANKVHALEAGCYDYITKPFDERELIARAKAAVQRHSRLLSLMPLAENEVLVIAGLEIDCVARRVVYQGSGLFLTASQFSLLETVARGRGKIVSREDLYARVLGSEFDPMDRKLDVLVSKLRKRLPANLIETVRGRGYRILGR